MRHEETIFDGVIRNENSFTELFKNFLRFKSFRKAFLKLIEFPFDKDEIVFDNFDTQFSTSKFGRPDLALITDEIEILFEIKISNTELTKNQPAGYYNYLKTLGEEKTKGLVLMTPEYYYDTNNYIKILEKAKSNDEEIYTQIIHWETISKVITDLEIEIISPLFQEYSNLLNRLFQLKPSYLDTLNASTMFDKKFPESLQNTMEIIDNVYHEYEKQGFSIRWTKEKDWAEYGFYFDLPDEESVFFGIWFDYWKNTGNPVCICLSSANEKQIKAFHTGVNKSNLSPAMEHDGYPTAFIKEHTLREENCRTTICNVLDEIISDIKLLNPVKQ